jgi:DNA-binding NarL/FixJ family response regulator
VLKQIRGADLISTVEKVAAGESLVDSALTGSLLDRIRAHQPQRDPLLATLTPTERTVLGFLVEGRTNREIAPLINVAPMSVKNYVSSILSKLGVASRTEAAVFALRSGEFDPPQ